MKSMATHYRDHFVPLLSKVDNMARQPNVCEHPHIPFFPLTIHIRFAPALLPQFHLASNTFILVSKWILSLI